MTYRVSLISPTMPHALRGLRADMDRAFDSMLRPVSTPQEGAWAPAADVIEDIAGWTLVLDVPGVAPEALEVLAEERLLTIRGERPALQLPDGARGVSHERRTGAFTRQLRLPATADAQQLSAELAHGVLTVRIGKVAPAQPRRVPVQSADRTPEREVAEG